MHSSRGSSQPRDQIYVSYISCFGRRVPYLWDQAYRRRIQKKKQKVLFSGTFPNHFFLFFFESTSGIFFPSLVAEKKMDLKFGRKLLEDCQSLALVLDRGSVPIWPADFWMEPYFILSVTASELMGIFLSLLQNHFRSFSACPCALQGLCTAVRGPGFWRSSAHGDSARGRPSRQEEGTVGRVISLVPFLVDCAGLAPCFHQTNGSWEAAI